MAVEFEAVIADGVIWPAYTDDDGRLFIDVDYEVDVPVDHAIVDGVIYPAWIDDDGRLLIDLES